MEKNNIIVLVVVAVVAIAAVAIGFTVLNNDDSEGDRVVTDMRERAVTVPGSFDDILCVNCCSLELISWFDAVNDVCAIDSEDSIIENKTYTQVHKSLFSSLETIDRSNSEAIILLNPDIVITSTVSVQELDNMQSTYGIPVFAINADLEFGSSEWFEQITVLGDLLNEEERAEDIVDGVNSIIKDIKSKTVSDVSGYACGMMFYGMGSFLKSTGDYLPFDYSGVENVMPTNPSGKKQPYASTIEQILAKEFDYIFIDGSNVPAVVTEMEGYIDTLTLGDEPAIVNDNVYKVMTYKVWGTQWDNQLINCLYVASVVNGSAYDWTFEDKANEVLELFYGDDALSYATVAAAEPNGGCGKVTI